MTDQARWRRIEELLDRALDLEPGRRAAFIAGATPDDPTLGAEVESLLRAHDDAGSFLETPGPPSGEVESLAGLMIGPWRVGRALGRGGMGAVYLAERADGQFEQHVALKVVKRGMDSEEILQRFRAERQILARLEHANIARLVDGGSGPDGRPWLALEYVDGEPITRYADARKLGVGDRLRLFHQVCEAVRYAHQNLVVHRDLKPSNILVTAAGDVKLLDFGIAKVLHGQAAGEATLTALGQWVLTPEYGAPEQVRGEPVTTATDVYALGAVLYELLTGRRAHQFADRSLDEVLRVVCEVEPERPSAAVRRAVRLRHSDGREETIAVGELASARGLEPDALSRALTGDLDTIVLKALDKAPDRRYPSAEALVDDLRRFEAGLPVRAQPDSPAYRLRKFVRRYRLAVSAAAVVVLALAAGLTVALWEAHAARREAERARIVRDVAVRMFEVPLTMQAGQQVIYPRELLDEGVRQVDSALTNEPALRQELLARLGRIHRRLGYLVEADTLLSQALRAARQAYGPNHLDVAARLEDLSQVRIDAGDYAAAVSLLREALDIRRRRLASDDPGVVATAEALALALAYSGAAASAESLLTTGPRAAGGSVDPVGEIRRLHLLAGLRETRTAWAAADSAWSAALALSRATRRPGIDSLVTQALDGLAAVRERQGDFVTAVALRRERLARTRPSAGDPVARADAEAALGAALLHGEGLAEAESLLTRALATERRELGDEHPTTLTTANDLALVHARTGRLAEAVAELRATVRLASRALGPDAPTTVTLRHNLGVLEARR